MNYKDEEQIELQYEKENEEECHDEFAENIKPLEELLDSVRDVDGFPIGEDEDILALSDPPYYTACPNPYINEFIDKYGKLYDPDTDEYHRTPFVGDVSEGKNDPIYNAHSYHTKVPHKAIKKFIEHYTEEGDIVFDGFCGSGMTGVAAQMIDRYVVLADLSPAATYISYNLNIPANISKLHSKVKKIYAELKNECGWMYETLHTDGKTMGWINYIVWSDIYICPYCGNEYVLWDIAVDEKSVKDRYHCPECNANITKKECTRAANKFYDDIIKQNIIQTKQIPVKIFYTVGKHRFEKRPNEFDLELIKKIERSAISYWFPAKPMMDIGERWGDTWRAGYHLGISHSHHFFTKRNLWVLAAFYNRITSNKSREDKLLKTFFTSLFSRSHKMNRYMPSHKRHVGPLSGTLYISYFQVEINVLNTILDKLKSYLKVYDTKKNKAIISTQSITQLTNIKNNAIDYIFIDPPFGSNLMYSELNHLWEVWLKVLSNNQNEAIINTSQNKDISQYKKLINECLAECYRILKPNRWITVEFHNSMASVWNAIQDSLTRSGFVVAQVSVIDKQKGTTKQLTYGGTVKNDLVINAYKPKQDFSERFLKSSGKKMEIEFISEHLAKLPLEPNIERTEQMLYSKLLAHYVQRGFAVRFNARQFYKLLRDNFYLIDGFWFKEDQVLSYEEWKKAYGLSKIEDLKSGQQVLIGDEKSALMWLYQYLEEPKTFGDIYNAFHKIAIQTDDLMPEPKVLLNNNFIFENNSYRRPYSELEQETVEMQREKELQRAFESLLTEAQTSKKRLKSVRKEALKYGFTKAYQEKRFADILRVANKLDNRIMEENSDINDFVEVARIKMGEG